jgi:hypothetical protein
MQFVRSQPTTKSTSLTCYFLEYEESLPPVDPSENFIEESDSDSEESSEDDEGGARHQDDARAALLLEDLYQFPRDNEQDEGTVNALPPQNPPIPDQYVPQGSFAVSNALQAY